MSKIICDVCGSAYSDTASQCPICGTAKRDNYAASADQEQTSENGYTYVKGGRFSHSNVRKHNNGKQLTRKSVEKSESTSSMPPLVTKKEQPAQPKPERKPEPKPAPKKEYKPVAKPEPKPTPRTEEDTDSLSRSTNIILIIIVFILLVAVIFAGIYVVQNYKNLFGGETDPTDGTTGTQQTIGGVYVPCTAITLPALEVVESDGRPVKLDVKFTPSHTTEDKLFVSSDPNVATVDNKGMLTVHSSGQVTITISCGEQTAELTLTCVLNGASAPTTEPSEPTVPSVPEGALKFIDARGKEAESVTFTKYGEDYQLYKGEIEASLVTFTSSDTAIVTIDEAGKIKVVGSGIATVYAEYGNQKIQCKVICSNVVIPVETPYKISFSEADPKLGDITIKVGEKQHIQLLDKETKAPVTGLTWYTSMEGYISIEPTTTGVRVTGIDVTVGVKGVAYVRVMCDYEGVTYTCIVRVKAPPETEPAGE